VFRFRDPDGKRYYKAFLASLMDAGISIIADLYHHDLPMDLQDVGGWASDATINQFVNYTRDVFDLLGGHVGHWITIASPLEEVMCD